jgi:hypothetical protein
MTLLFKRAVSKRVLYLEPSSIYTMRTLNAFDSQRFIDNLEIYEVGT